MTTRHTIERYFSALSNRDRWEEYLDDEVRFVSHVTPPKEVSGRSAYVASTRGFYSMIEGLKLEGLIVDGDRACAQTRYRLRPPQGDAFNCDVSEVFSVRGNKIVSFEIYFDSVPFGRRVES
jgi:ketosteroid isomerase-like protein